MYTTPGAKFAHFTLPKVIIFDVHVVDPHACCTDLQQEDLKGTKNKSEAEICWET